MESVDDADQIWEKILADPLDWPSTIPLPSQVEDYHFMEDPKPRIFEYLGGFIPKENWSRGPRALRKRRMYKHKPPYLQNVPSEENDKHWKQHEVIKLVKGVETYGVGAWKKIKLHYFSPPVGKPVRTKENLKDKWRNLLIASAKPEAQRRMYLPLDSWIIKWIQGIATS